MIRHLFKLTWNKKKKHIFLIVELFFFFLATGFIALFLYESKVLKSVKPSFNIDNVVSIRYQFFGDSVFRSLVEELKQIDAVKEISLSSQIPYMNILNERSVTYKGKTIKVAQGFADDKFKKVLDLKLRSGRWFEKNDVNRLNKLAVIDVNVQDKLFDKKNPIGRLIKIEDVPYQVIGVIENLNDPSNNDYLKDNIFEFARDGYYSILLKLKKPMNEDIYNQLKETTDRFIGGNIMPISQYRDTLDKKKFIPLLILSLLAGFLVINIILGLFSILYQNINTRRSEIGLRRAAGATSADIYRQIMMEMFLLATLALIPCLIVGYQFMAFNVLNATTGGYICAMVSGAITIYLLVIICALYPARMASKIHPAEALHDD